MQEDPDTSRATNYDSIAAQFDAYGKDEKTTDMLLGIKYAIPLYGEVRGKYFLDYGCATGRTSRIFASLGARVTGVDIADKELKLAQRNNPDIAFLSIANGISGLEGKFDAAALNFVACAVGDQMTLRQIFGNLHKMLKPGGRLVMINPNYEEGPNRTFMTTTWGAYKQDEGAPIEITLGERKGVKLRDYFWSKKLCMKLLAEAGFRIEALLQPRAGPFDGDHPWKDEKRHPPTFIISAIAEK